MNDTAKISPPTTDAQNLFQTALAAAKAIDLDPITLDDGRVFFLTPKGFDLKEITDPERLKTHAEASIVVDEKDALSAYVNRFKETNSTVLVADVDAGTVKAVLDYHLPDGGIDVVSGACKHVATLKLRESEEFKRWNDFEQRGLIPQAEFAQFLEENATDIAQPFPADMIEIARDLSASVGAKFRSGVDLTSGDRTFTYEQETVVDKVTVPREILLQIPLYQGEEPIALRAAFRFRVTGSALLLGIEWRRVVYQQLALFKQIAFAVAEATGAPIYLGRFSK